MIHEVRVGPFRYDVVLDAAAIDAESVDLKRNLSGCCNNMLGRISIRPGQGQDETCDTLLHEVLHAVFHQTGLELLEDDEEIIRRLSPALLDLIRRNPDLLKFLVFPGTHGNS